MITRTCLTHRVVNWIAVGVLGGLLASCGDNNLLSGFADDDSPEAKLALAQAALDAGDCPTAVTLYGELQAADTSSVARRLDLSAAYLCAAGFDVREFIEVAALFGGGTVASDQVFETIADQALTSMSATWPTEIGEAEALLASDLTATPPTSYDNDEDAAFNLAIVQAVKAVLTVSDILNYVDGAVDCVATQGSTDFTNCQITTSDVTAIVNALDDASGLLGTLGVSSEVQDSINTVLADLNAVDGNASNAVTCADLQSYLTTQGFDMTGVTCV